MRLFFGDSKSWHTSTGFNFRHKACLDGNPFFRGFPAGVVKSAEFRLQAVLLMLFVRLSSPCRLKPELQCQLSTRGGWRIPGSLLLNRHRRRNRNLRGSGRGLHVQAWRRNGHVLRAGLDRLRRRQSRYGLVAEANLPAAAQRSGRPGPALRRSERGWACRSCCCTRLVSMVARRLKSTRCRLDTG